MFFRKLGSDIDKGEATIALESITMLNVSLHLKSKMKGEKWLETVWEPNSISGNENWYTTLGDLLEQIDFWFSRNPAAIMFHVSRHYLNK